MIEAVYWLSQIEGIGPRKIKELAPTQSHIRKLWVASLIAMQEDFNISAKLARLMINSRCKDKIEAELNMIREKGIHMLTYLDETYPDQLKSIYDPPPILYMLGNIDLLFQPWDHYVAVIGTRKPSPYGCKMTKKIAGDLAKNSVVIVSGLAKGIDGAAHQEALLAGGKTIAVLGCGCDTIYPKVHTKLYNDILNSGGLIVSELVPGTKPLKHHFPKRNRIISGLSTAVVVMEAGERSGSLITARKASDQGRLVMALPGNVTNPVAKGTLQAIREGAVPIGDVQDILNELNIQLKSSNLEGDLVKTTLEKSLAMVEPATADQISSLLDEDVYDIMMQLTLLEVKGRVKRLPGGLYVCA